MGNIFSSESPFFIFLSKLCDLIFLSTVWFFMCIPIITIGPANTALYYATVKVIRRERGYLFREFFKSFKLNFKKGAIIGVITTLLFLVLAFDIYVTYTSTEASTGSSVFMGIYLALLIILTCFSLYVYPVLSRFELSIKQLYKLSIYLCVRHPLHTLGMLLIMAVSVVGVVFNLLLLFLVPAAGTFLSSFLMEPVLKKYTPKSESSEDEPLKDEWYLE
ncbi:MAG: YesL family protein [Clostridiales bacterium]|nr:YesL family protein [Clostridiales bacterium]